MTEGNGKAALGAGLPGRLRRVLAPNPSPMTGPGTWTDIVGSGEVAIIDPGPNNATHLQALLAALEPGEQVTAILVTHAHLDHSALAPALSRATGAPILGFGTATDGRSPVMQRLVASGMTSGGEGLDLAFSPDRRLVDDEVIKGPDWALRVLHTPGHLGGHLCLAWDDTLFTGDHVMGWAPSLVSPPDGDMGAYMASLARLGKDAWRLFLPTHGEPVTDPSARLAALTAHRRLRESQVQTALRAGPARLPEITDQVYQGLATDLLPAARRNTLAHLIDLAERNLAMADRAPGSDALWSIPRDG